MTDLTHRTRLAHADAWQVLGAVHVSTGGGVARVAGGSLMASGLPHPQYNNVDVLDPELIDLAGVADWYADRDVPWGARVPADAAWSAGRKLFRKRLMALDSGDLRRPDRHASIRIAAAGPEDLATVVRLDVAAFGGDVQEQTPWMGPLLRSERVTVAVAYWNDTPAGTGYAVASDGDAGPAVYIAGIGVDPSFRRRGIGAAMSAWLVERAGAGRLAHLHPDTDAAARIYERLGFVEVPGFDVYVDLGTPPGGSR